MAFIDDLDNLHESQRLEFKEAAKGLPLDLWETYSAFSNTEGGEIVLGVKEFRPREFDIVGVQNASALIEDFWKTVRNPQRVERDVMLGDDVKAVEVRSSVTVVIISVPRAERTDKPVRVYDKKQKGFAAFVRRGEDDFLASDDDIRLMTYDNISGADRRPLDGFTSESFCAETVARYRNLFAASRPNSPWVNEPDEDFLFHIGALSKGRDDALNATQAGLLAFGYDYEITRHFPHYIVDYRQETSGRLRWDDRIVSSSADWSGNLIDFYLTVSDRIKRHFKMPFATDASGMRHGTENPITEAVNEAVTNALVHAYYGADAAIRVLVHGDGVEVSNSGSFLIDREVAVAGGISVARNPTLMNIFYLLGASDRAGSGLYSMWAIWQRTWGLVPVIEETHSPAAVRLSMPFDSSEGNEESKEGDVLRELRHMIALAKTATAADVAEAFGVSERTAQKRLKRLMDQSEGDVIRVRDGKAWRYSLK